MSIYCFIQELTAMAEFVVPRSMPTTFANSCEFLSRSERAAFGTSRVGVALNLVMECTCFGVPESTGLPSM